MGVALTDLPGIGPARRDKLVRAGVVDGEALRAVDLIAVSAATGIPAPVLEAARAALPAPDAPAPEPEVPKPAQPHATAETDRRILGIRELRKRIAGTSAPARKAARRELRRLRIALETLGPAPTRTRVARALDDLDARLARHLDRDALKDRHVKRIARLAKQVRKALGTD